MTEGTTALGAPARVEALDMIETYERLRDALRQLQQLLRLHEAEAQRALTAGTGTTAREVAASWISANELLTHTVAELRAVEVKLTSQLDAVLHALRAIESKPVSF